MANVFDVAGYILTKKGPLTAMKLQKLCYYAQAWNMVWDERPIFLNTISAWKYGPVCPDLYSVHAGQLIVDSSIIPNGSCENNLTKDEIETIEAVLVGYGEYTAQQLSDLTHSEEPWKIAIARKNEGYSDIISQNSMHEFYSNIQNS